MAAGKLAVNRCRVAGQMNIDKARETQRAVDAAYAPAQLTPLPLVVEDNSEEAWAARAIAAAALAKLETLSDSELARALDLMSGSSIARALDLMSDSSIARAQSLASAVVPVIDRLDAKVYEAVGRDGLDMSSWHCGTTHCRAGWAVALAGERGAALEKLIGSELAGRLIYEASTGRMAPDFYASDEDARADIARCAGKEPQ